MKINVNYHSSICINDNIYVDPLKVYENHNAKYIFITHSHYDHFSKEDISKIITNETVIVCPKTMEKEVKNVFNNIVLVEPNCEYKVNDVKFKTFNSYNISKPFHPKENGWVGYIIEIDKEKVTIIGDSDLTPELKQIKTDILLVPVGGHYTMGINDAVNLTNIIKPKRVIPTHYGEIVGTKDMGEEFKSKINNNVLCEVYI